MGLDKYLVLVSVSQLPSFLCGGIEIDLNSEWGSNWLNFRRWAEINLIFVLEIELDLVLVLGSKVTCFLCGRSKLTVCGLKLTYFESDDRLIWFCVSDGGQNWLGFCMWAVNRLVLVWASKLTWFEIDLVSALGSKLTSFLGGGQNRLRFVCGQKITWFEFMDRKWLGV